MEYTKNKLAAFVSLNASNTGYDREDYFLYTPDDPLRRVGTYNFFGFGAKGGANYNITGNHNVFLNVGYFEKAPGFDAVFPNFTNDNPNVDAENQKILSFEVGYGLRKKNFTANINFYHTEWLDRTYTDFFTGANGEELVANILGVDALHQGVEIDAVWKPNSDLTITGMKSEAKRS